ncbi:pantoate--beta-alanine ligase [Reichenbachiella sp. MALMAid0571]|uniref:pantoate--beta-alanine ligase n=1 Tax=Reichenbachiella sp. MALMAid0571 TaxID=3143939 RepID=UPI0032E0222B
MKVFDSIGSVRSFLNDKRRQGSQIGLVPTMGSLHKGHFNLIKLAAKNNNIVVVSIFVNPTQFNKKEDLQNYPRDLDKDIKALENIGCQAVFVPSEREMYPSNRTLTFEVGYIGKIMEGKFRPGHFAGVALIVTKLFNVIAPNYAYFGQKDLQQLVLIKNLVRELNFDLEIVEVPTVREASGLAMSSRNQRLNGQEKNLAANIYKGLQILKNKIVSGIGLETSISETKEFYKNVEGFDLEYLEIVRKSDLLPISKFNSDIETALCVAGYVADVRLLDNLCINPKV